jgi:hypothetical protein
MTRRRFFVVPKADAAPHVRAQQYQHKDRAISIHIIRMYLMQMQ